MKQPISEELVIHTLDFLIRLRPFEGTSTLDGKTEFILFWAIYARIPFPENLSECYWTSARWIPKEFMNKFLKLLKVNPENYETVDYPEWAYYQKDMSATYIYQTYNKVLEKSIPIKRIDNQVKRVVDFTIDFLNEELGYVINENNLKKYIELYFNSALFLETIQDIKLKSKLKKGKIEKKNERKNSA